MSKKKSVSIILAAMLTISIGITGCGPKGTESGSGSSSSLTGSDNLTVSGGDDLISAVSDGSQSADSSQSGSRPGGTGGGNGENNGNTGNNGNNGSSGTGGSNNSNGNSSSSNSNAVNNLYSVNVADVGLKGDGKTDNSEKLQDIIDALGENKSYYFPAGTYVFNSTVYFKRFTTFVGTPSSNGVGGTTLKAGRNMEYVFSSSDGSYAHGNSFSNFTCDGNSGSRKVSSFFYLGSVLGCSFQNMKFTNITGNGIESVRVTQNPYDWTSHYHQLEFTNVKGYAIDTTQTDSWYSNISVNGGKGIIDRINGGSVYRNVTVTNSTEAGLTIGTPNRSETMNTCIVNCTFKNNATYGLYLATGTNRADKQATISNCDFSGNKSGDIYMNKVAETSVYQCNLRSANPVKTDSISSGISFVENSVAAASFSLQGSQHEQRGNTFSAASFPSDRGAKVDSNDAKTLYQTLTEKKAVSVFDYDAQTGSGIDLSGALKKAIAALPNGGVVLIPKGEYGLASTVTVPSNITIYGMDAVIYPLKSVGTMFHVKGASNVTFTGFHLSNSKDVALTQMILFENSKNCNLINFAALSVKNTSKAAIVINSGSSGINFRYCSFSAPENSGSNTVILHSGSNSTIHDCYFTHGTIGVHFSGGKNNKIYATHFDWFTTTALKFTNTSSAAMNHAISNCYFDINYLVALFDFSSTYNASVTMNCNTFRADGNVISQGQLPPVIRIKNGTNLSFTANVFEHPKAFVLEGSTTNVKIIGNASKGNLIASGSTASCTIENNAIRG